MSQPLQILIAEDCENDARLIIEALREAQFDPQWERVQTEADFLHHLQPQLDLIISDFRMPDLDGFRALQLLQEKGYEIPFFLISGTIGEETAVEAIKRGATDYLLKDRLARLGPAVRQALEQGRLRKQALQATEDLRRERDFISAVVDTVGSLVVVLDRQGRIVRFNRACEQLTGYSFDEVKGRYLPDLLLPIAERTKVIAALTRLCSGHFPNSYENQWVTRQGKLRLIAWSNTALVDATGAVEFIIGTGNDITEQKNIMERNAEQAALLDKAQDAILVRDLNGTILFWNKGAERLYGWTRAEAVGRNMGELLYSQPGEFEELNRLYLKQNEGSGEMQHCTKDRRPLTVEARWTLVRDDAGSPKSVLAINTDITEKKRIEAQFMRAQRTESIGTLAGGIAHDLNNILAPIMMSIEMLKLTATNPQAERILNAIEVSSKRGADIVRQILSFARGLDGQLVEIQPKNLFKDIKTIITDAFPKNIQLELSFPEDAWTVLGDSTQLHQIFLNLCVNARDAMPHGGRLGITLENVMLDRQYAAMHPQARAGRYVSISVRDSGLGIPPAILEKIFEPFFTTKDIGKGTGLGLSTVAAIVKSHSGFVNVYSEVGKGSIFKVFLPATESSSTEIDPVQEAENLPRGKGETILIVDDEASILSITSQTLDTFGYRTLTANDGAEAVALYAEHRNEISLVLTDMAMPLMDGKATIRALRKMNPAIKVVAASGMNPNDDSAQHSGDRPSCFLAKPYTAETLLKMVRTTLDEAQPHSQDERELD